MFTSTFLTGIFLLLVTASTAAQHTNSHSHIAHDTNIPAGYQVGFSTQDNEPPNQQSICTTNCILAKPFANTTGPARHSPDVFAAAINPALGGGPTDCSPCGDCYHIIHSGMPYCNPDPYNPACGAPSGPLEQHGAKSIKILITNHCPDCNDVTGHFDINASPAGWNNPKVYWKKLGRSKCQ